MATAVMTPQSALPKASTFKPIIKNGGLKRKTMHVDFEPKVHLAYDTPENIIMMKDIGFTENTGVSPVAVSEPFRLFSAEAVQKFRDEVLSDEVLEKCSVKSNLAALQLRGHAPKYAPFTYDAWTNPETLSVISKIAGVELVPWGNYEIAHVNISVKSERETKEELAAVERERQGFADDEGIAGCPWEDDKPVVGWHTDSYPFVCVTMLSDCTNMIGGETALRTGNGDVMRVRGPQMGCAVVMQGRYICHQALRALGAQERITMVTSFRPKSPFLADDSVLTTVRGISDLRELYYEFAKYRLEMMEERIRVQLKDMRAAYRAGKKTDTHAIKAFLTIQETFLQHTNQELVPDELVVHGHLPELEIPDVKVVGLATPPLSAGEPRSKRAHIG